MPAKTVARSPHVTSLTSGGLFDTRHRAVDVNSGTTTMDVARQSGFLAIGLSVRYTLSGIIDSFPRDSGAKQTPPLREWGGVVLGDCATTDN
jgi:hypothetical protein